MKNFAMTGVAGFVAPRHLKAIRDTGNRLVAAVDPHDAVGILDRYSFDVRFFTEFERFDRHLEKLRRGPEADRVHYLSVCSPNYLHDAHIRLALRIGADAICEKPLVINPWNLDALQELERETGRRVYTVLQLRVHPDLIALRERLAAAVPDEPHDVVPHLRHRARDAGTTSRGRAAKKSGGLVTNIGVHFFDLLVWLFGSMRESELHLNEDEADGGVARARARARALVPVGRHRDLPFAAAAGHARRPTVRSPWTARRSSSAKGSPICTRASTKRSSPVAASASTTRDRRSS